MIPTIQQKQNVRKNNDLHVINI